MSSSRCGSERQGLKGGLRRRGIHCKLECNSLKSPTQHLSILVWTLRMAKRSGKGRLEVHVHAGHAIALLCFSTQALHRYLCSIIWQCFPVGHLVLLIMLGEAQKQKGFSHVWYFPHTHFQRKHHFFGGAPCFSRHVE